MIGYDWFKVCDLPLHLHPEYEKRASLPSGKFVDWIEGCDRRHPGYKKGASSAANRHIMERMDLSLPDHAVGRANFMHLIWKLSAAEVTYALQDGRNASGVQERFLYLFGVS